MIKYLQIRFKLFIRGLYNFITDLAVPFLSFLAIVVPLLPVPTKYLVMIKTAEEFCKKFGATRQEVQNRINYRR